MFATYGGVTLSSIMYSVAWAVNSYANIHAKDAYVWVIFYAWDFYVFFRPNAKLPRSSNERRKSFSTTGKILKEINRCLTS